MTKKNAVAIFSILLFFSLFFSSCNLPIRSEQPAVQQPPADILASAVALTLTSAPIQPIAPTTEMVLTVTPTGTGLPATATLTQTPTPIATPIGTITITLTPPSDDPAVLLGNPTGKDNLDNGKGFGLTSPYEDDYTRFNISDGAMNLGNSATNGWRGWRVRPPKLANFYLEGTLITDSCSGKDSFGLVFRAADYSSGSGYYYGITCDGRFMVSRMDSGGVTTLVNPAASDKIKAGPGQTNRLGVWAQGSQFKLYVNGKMVSEMDDSTFKEGFYGPFTSGFSGGLACRLDSIAYWTQP